MLSQPKKKTIVGVDAHKDTLACYCNGEFREFKTNLKGFEQALNEHPRIAIGLSRKLIALKVHFLLFLQKKDVKYMISIHYLLKTGEILLKQHRQRMIMEMLKLFLCLLILIT